MYKQTAIKGFILGLAMLGAAACTATPKSDSDPYAAGPIEPVEAFEQVGEPQREYVGAGTNDPDDLSSDIERLQDARREYNQAQDRQASEHSRNQAECRESEATRKVPIEDGSPEPAVFCEE